MFHSKTHINSHSPKSHRSIALRPILIDTMLVVGIVLFIAVVLKAYAMSAAFPSVGSSPVTTTNPPERADTAALLARTHDESVPTRVEAINSIGTSGDVTALPRLRALLVTDGNESVQRAAHVAEQQLLSRVAQSVNLPATSIRDIAVASSGVTYLATMQDLYVRRDETWTYVNSLPDAALSLTVTPDSSTLYLATASAGLFSSENGGATWKYVGFGLNTPTQLIATAVVVDPKDSSRAYAALVTPGQAGQKNPLGIFWTQDRGESWRYLENSPSQAVTSLLVIDPDQPEFLFGLEDDTPWRYPLPQTAT